MTRAAERLFLLLSLLTLALLAAAIYQAETPPWKAVQREFFALSVSHEKDPAAQRRLLRTPPEIQQVVLTGLARVDRCPTCHLGVEDPTMAQAAQPFRYHAGLEPHRPLRFGCTVCHGGQGLATGRQAAHGLVANWPEPRLPKRYLRASCGRCHREGAIPGAPEMQQARALIAARGCRGCHRLNGAGNTIGPELSNESRAGRTPAWLEQHFRDPRSVTATSPMPDFRFAQAEIEALTFYLLSLTTQPMEAYYLSVPMLPTAESGRQLYLEGSCASCHALQGVGGQSAPDLHGVTTRRSARWLERLGHWELTRGMPDFSFSTRGVRSILLFLDTAGAAEARALQADLPGRLSSEQARIEAGRRATLRFGCVGCHAQGLLGGTPNPNSQGGQVPALIHLADDYRREEVAAIIRRGRLAPVADPKKRPPPLFMPTWRNILAPEDIQAIIDYAWSLRPAGSEAW